VRSSGDFVSFPVPPEVKLRVVDIVGSQIAWWWCVLFQADGQTALALLAPTVYVISHIALRGADRVKVAKLAAAGALFGFVGDTLLVAFDLLAFPQHAGASLSVPFMLALWAAFAVSLPVSWGRVIVRPAWVLAALGAAAGPIAYFAGARTSVLELAPGALLAVSFEWALAFPMLSLLARPARPIKSREF
jgi:hypothetical protein